MPYVSSFVTWILFYMWVSSQMCVSTAGVVKPTHISFVQHAELPPQLLIPPPPPPPQMSGGRSTTPQDTVQHTVFVAIAMTAPLTTSAAPSTNLHRLSTVPPPAKNCNKSVLSWPQNSDKTALCAAPNSNSTFCSSKFSKRVSSLSAALHATIISNIFSVS